MGPKLTQQSDDTSASSSGVSSEIVSPPTPATPTTPPSPAGDNHSLPRTSLQTLGLLEQPECIQDLEDSGSGTRPLMVIHDGSGLCVQYRRLCNLPRPIHAIHDSHLMEARCWSSLSEMADQYTTIAEETYAKVSSPIVLSGWSFGGVVAFEVGCRLLTRGKAVAGVVLIDSPPPIDHQPLSEEIVDQVTGSTSLSSANRISQVTRRLTRRNFARCAALLADFEPRDPNNRRTPKVVLLRSENAYENPSLRGPFNRWLQDRSDPKTAVKGWEKVTGGKIDVVDIPGNHFEAFDNANVEAVSERLEKACKQF